MEHVVRVELYAGPADGATQEVVTIGEGCLPPTVKADGPTGAGERYQLTGRANAGDLVVYRWAPRPARGPRL